ncbi:MAG: mechanosensitive ion channel family protein [Phycisphaerales bacterium]|nr:MAG: mechanosensitive ion channel family protein [Phycisphaerales bacterium]
MAVTETATIGLSEGVLNIVNYEIIKGNPLWRLGLVLVVVLAAMVTGRIVQFAINGYAGRREQKTGRTALTIFLRCFTKPASVAIFGVGLYLCRLCLVFEDKTATPVVEGISSAIEKGWGRIAQTVIAIAVAYWLYRLVDIIEHLLWRWTSRTETKLDDMLVPAVRKSLRVTVAIVTVIFIVDNILEQDVGSILLGAGVGGIAVALAAKDTIANFFGSITIFADRPFQMGELIKVDDHVGPVEEVGFRSTRVRTLDGHLVTVPNSVIANSIVENIGRRPFIRRTSNITITYDSGHTKAAKAVEIIKDVLADVPEVNTDPDRPPRVYFSDFNDWSLNIYMSYWVKPADYWLYQEVNERVNLEMMRRFEEAGIEFAFPSQTLYMKKD